MVFHTVQHKAQKIKGILNTFGVYDYTNDKMYTHCYRNKTSEQFIDFIRRIDSKYDSSIKTIFIVLDNASIHRSKKTRNAIVRNYPRIVLVFQPTRSPELNLIEVRWMWLQRKAINNSIHLEMNLILERQYLIGYVTTITLMAV